MTETPSSSFIVIFTSHHQFKLSHNRSKTVHSMHFISAHYKVTSIDKVHTAHTLHSAHWNGLWRRGMLESSSPKAPPPPLISHKQPEPQPAKCQVVKILEPSLILCCSLRERPPHGPPEPLHGPRTPVEHHHGPPSQRRSRKVWTQRHVRCPPGSIRPWPCPRLPRRRWRSPPGPGPQGEPPRRSWRKGWRRRWCLRWQLLLLPVVERVVVGKACRVLILATSSTCSLGRSATIPPLLGNPNNYSH